MELFVHKLLYGLKDLNQVFKIIKNEGYDVYNYIEGYMIIFYISLDIVYDVHFNGDIIYYFLESNKKIYILKKHKKISYERIKEDMIKKLLIKGKG